MNALWSYFWPCFAVGLLVGAMAGLIAFRRRRGRELRVVAGLACALVLAALWHGPLGGADRFRARVEQDIQQMLVHYEMTQVTAHLHQHPLTRRVMLSGPADDFQHDALVSYIDTIPGVAGTTWSDRGGTPLIVEGLVASLVGYLLGLLLAYLVELRRRYNKQWNW